MFKLMDLPFEKDALQPYISKETVEYHYEKHHRTYINKLNNLIEKENKFFGFSLEKIIKNSSGKIFNNAAQIWNHDFYWKCLRSPRKSNSPEGKLLETIQKKFGSFNQFKNLFNEKSLNFFGSGWIWLVQKNEHLEILETSNAEVPLLKDLKPILVCDIWEHAYYIDYRNNKAKYLEGFWKMVNWKFVEEIFISKG